MILLEEIDMKLEWKGNQKYNEDISKATIREIEVPFRMSIHKYIGCGSTLFFDCPKLEISCVDLDTDNFDEAEKKAMNMLQDKLSSLVEDVESVLNKFNS